MAYDLPPYAPDAYEDSIERSRIHSIQWIRIVSRRRRRSRGA